MALNAISRSDEQVLTWFFSDGLCEFERSIHGSLMSRSTNGGHEECPGCSGSGWTRIRMAECPDCTDGYAYPQGASFPRDEGGAGKPFQVVAERPHACPTCRESETAERGRRVVTLKTHDPRPAVTVDEQCEQCMGLGVVGLDGHPMVRSLPEYHYVGGQLLPTPHDTIPAFPGGHEVKNPPPEPDDRALRRYGLVARRLGHMRARDIRVLFAIYGIGIHWSRQVRDANERAQERSRLRNDETWPVMALTSLGKKTLTRFSKRPPEASLYQPRDPEHDFVKWWEELTAPEQLQKLCWLPDKDIDHRVWAEMREQASRLVERATRAWNVASARSGTMGWAEHGPERPKRRKRAKKPERLQVTAVRLMGLRRKLELDTRAA